MAQDYTFSNNLPLLVPQGQFGTRFLGGKDSASARYIFTKLQPITRRMFKADDDLVLTHNDDDGFVVEPKVYYPVIPLLLVNGSSGIGTGYSTSVPSFHPVDVIDNVVRELNSECMHVMYPWSWGYTGPITTTTQVPGTNTLSGDLLSATINGQHNVTVKKFTSKGKFTVDADKLCVTITELPWNTWTAQYKQTLIDMLESQQGKDSKLKVLVSHFSESHTEQTVNFKVYFKKDMFTALVEGGVEDVLKLTSSINLTNMHAFDTQNAIKMYDDPRDMIREFVVVRGSKYEERRLKLIEILSDKLVILNNKMRFIQSVINGSLVVTRKKKVEIVKQLVADGYKTHIVISTSEQQEQSDQPQQQQGKDEKGYDYLLSMPIYSLTQEKVVALQADVDSLTSQVDKLQRDSGVNMWKRELGELREYLMGTMKIPLNHNTINENNTHDTGLAGIIAGLKGKKTTTTKGKAKATKDGATKTKAAPKTTKTKATKTSTDVSG